MSCASRLFQLPLLQCYYICRRNPFAFLPASYRASSPESCVALPFYPESCAYHSRYSGHFDRPTCVRCDTLLPGWVTTFCLAVFVSSLSRWFFALMLTLLHNSIFYLFVFLMSQTMKSFFRAVAACFKTRPSAIAFSGIFIILMSLYGGYTVPWPTAPKGLRWIMWLNVRHPLYDTFFSSISILLS
jgi:ABC-type multidrug transport system permease subunit